MAKYAVPPTSRRSQLQGEKRRKEAPMASRLSAVVVGTLRAPPTDRLLVRKKKVSKSTREAKVGSQRSRRASAMEALQQQGVLERLEDVPGVVFSLAGLYNKLLELWVFQHSVPAATNAEVEPEPAAVDEREVIRAAYQLFEGEFARPLSPLELEKLNAWLIADRWDFALLKEAMRRAVLHNALNLAYIDKILLRWKREGITNMEQLLASEANQEAETSADKTNRRARQARSSRVARNKPQAAEPGFAAEVDYAQYF